MPDTRLLQPASTQLDPLICWIAEREAIRIKKERGDAPPWTYDQILAAYRFCNVRWEDGPTGSMLAKDVERGAVKIV